MATGKWCEPGVPHRGWVCEGVIDLGSVSATCEMCEVQAIRFVHYMQHPDYPDELEVGCICAGHMEANLVRARQREAIVRATAGRERRWLTRRWHRSHAGNPYLNLRGYNVVVYRCGAGWSTRVLDRESESGLRLRTPKPTLEEAKLEALRLLDRLRS